MACCHQADLCLPVVPLGNNCILNVSSTQLSAWRMQKNLKWKTGRNLERVKAKYTEYDHKMHLEKKGLNTRQDRRWNAEQPSATLDP